MRKVCKYCEAAFDGNPGASACPDCVAQRRRLVVRPRICRSCGTEFPGGPRAWYCPACRAVRQRQQAQAYRQRQQAGTVRPIGSTAFCEACGQPYTVSGGTQRYCPDCAPVIVREHINAQSRAWNAANTTPEERRAVRRASNAEIPCMVCGRMFVPVGARKTCSGECAEAAERQSAKAWEANNREARNAYHRARYRETRDSMTDAEWQAYRDEVNAQARENYKKRKDES